MYIPFPRPLPTCGGAGGQSLLPLPRPLADSGLPLPRPLADSGLPLPRPRPLVGAVGVVDGGAVGERVRGELHVTTTIHAVTYSSCPCSPLYLVVTLGGSGGLGRVLHPQQIDEQYTHFIHPSSLTSIAR